MKLVSILLILFSFLSAHGQQTVNCKILDAFLQDNNAKKVFGFDAYKDVPIRIVDLSNYFKGCETGDHYGRIVEITHDSSYQKAVNHSNIIVYNIITTDKRYKMEVYFKVREAYGYVYFKKKKNSFVVSKFSVGNF